MSLFGYTYMETRIHTYDEVCLLNVIVGGDRNCRVPYNGETKYHVRDVINKMACYFPYDQGDLISTIYDETIPSAVPIAANLYFAKEVKTNRDVYRNSGYSIVRDPDKADVIVVPDIRSDFYTCLHCNLVAKDEKTNELYLITISKSGYKSETFDSDDVDAVKDYITHVKGLTPDESQSKSLDVWFIPKCEHLCDVMNSVYPSRIYCQENKVPIKAPTNISPETLIFWENMTDMNLLVRTICTSDWRDYPITTTVFLTMKQEVGDSFSDYMNNDFRAITNFLGWKPWYGMSSALAAHSIGPKDYDMLQKYMFARVGIEENGGIIDAKQLNRIPSEVRSLLRYRIAIKPQEIPSSMTLSTIRKLVE